MDRFARQRLMSTITDHGGDVLRLAGDALIVAFTGELRCRLVEAFVSTPAAVRARKGILFLNILLYSSRIPGRERPRRAA